MPRLPLLATVVALTLAAFAATARAGSIDIQRIGPVGAARPPVKQPDTAEEFADAGAFHLVRGELDAALRDYRRAKERDPELARARQGLGDVLLLRDDPDASLAEYEEAVSLEPSARSFHGRATARLVLKDREGALADYRRAVRAGGVGVAVSQYMVGAVLADLGRSEEAISAYGEAIRLAPENPDAHAARGILQKDAGELDAAFKDFDRLVELAPESARGYMLRATAFAARRDEERMERDFARALELGPDRSDFHFLRGRCYLELGRPADALADLDAAIAAKPDRIEVPLVLRANAKARLGRFDEALADLDLAIDVKEDDADARLARARLHRLAGDLGKAAPDLERVLALRPDDVESLVLLGEIRYYEGRTEAAEALLSRAIERSPESPAARMLRGLARAAAGDLPTARADLAAAERLDPENAAIRMHHGRLLAESGRTAPALAELDRAVALAPKNAGMRETRALLLGDLGRHRESLEELRRSLDLEKDDPTASLYASLRLWLLETRLGDRAGADRRLAAFYEARPAEVRQSPWGLLALHLLGRVEENDLLAAAVKSAPADASGQLCEAAFFAGARRVVLGDAAGAIPLLRRAVATDRRDYTEYTSAVAELSRALGGVVLDAGEDGESTVASVRGNGPAARAGLAVGDRVKALNGKPATRREWLMTLARANATDPIRMTVRRGAEEPRTIEVAAESR